MERQFFKRIYSISEFYTSVFLAVRTIGRYWKSLRRGELSPGAAERIMLAVTEVNGCVVCSYVHTKIALEKGMSREDITAMLSGSSTPVPGEEAPAIFFAQHYADSRGKPSTDAWNRVAGEYGESKASGILGAARLMMAANIYGIALSALGRRFKGRPVKRSNIFYEIGMLLSIIVIAPAAAVHALISAISGRPLLQLNQGEKP